ncbi:hypothetical protein GIB67_022334 [Kingdonia uniflora]|uniref:GAGA-binding transcriptional activator n=1 Tax=Kingdonia uniflora TaxID=39325 RepID=A0A7J7MI47_9MAGN|nr:hypothetical protein GIB67_022334 [Kingdonia uniflora]
MDGGGQRENGRYRQDLHCNKNIHSQWMIPPQMMKDHQALTMKFMGILHERDAAIQERNLALSEKKTALTERDMALLQRDQAVTDLKNTLMERDNAIAALEYRDGSAASTEGNNPQGQRGTKQIHHIYNTREMQVIDALPISTVVLEPIKPRQAKRAKEIKALSVRKPSKSNKETQDRSLGQTQFSIPKPEWKCQDLLNQVRFDETSVPTPGCSCTGAFQPCYKWGKGGWQSSCCTTTLSMHPLPVMPNKRHARLGGRKMSASVFSRLLNHLAQEGHDLSNPLDLKDHWSKHGTNRYITIR